MINFIDTPYISLGCWKDKPIRAIDGFEGVLGVYGCFKRTAAKGFNVFGVQFGGECYTTPMAESTYNIYGLSTECSDAGTGGRWCLEVYKIGLFFRFESVVFAE